MKFKILLILAIMPVALFAAQPTPEPMQTEQPLLFEGLSDEVMLPLVQKSLFAEIQSAKTIEEALEAIQKKTAISEQFARIMNDRTVIKTVGEALARKFGSLGQQLMGFAMENEPELLTKILPFVNPNMQDKYGRTALMWAARNGHTQIAQMLLAAGANSNMQDKYGGTALMETAVDGHIQIAQILLAVGANPDMQIENGWTAATLARINGHEDIAKMIEGYSKKQASKQ